MSQSHGADGIAWRDWSEEAFAAARSEDKPALLTIGATWRHVMDQTSYSDARVIELVNSRFIPVRVEVDRRPRYPLPPPQITAGQKERKRHNDEQKVKLVSKRYPGDLEHPGRIVLGKKRWIKWPWRPGMNKDGANRSYMRSDQHHHDQNRQRQNHYRHQGPAQNQSQPVHNFSLHPFSQGSHVNR